MTNQKAAARCGDVSWPRMRQWLAAMAAVMMTALGSAAHADGTVPPIAATQPADGASLFADPGWIQNLSQYLPACIHSYHGATAFGDPQTFEAECIVDVSYVSLTGTCYYASETGPAVCSQVRCSNCSASPPTPVLLPARGHFVYLSHYAGLPSTALQVCPANSTQTGASCTCDEDFAPDTVSGTSCVPKVDVPRASDPPQSCPFPKDKGQGNPIHALRGVKREVVDTGLAIGRLTLQFTYDNSSKIPRVPAQLAAQPGPAGKQARGGVLGGRLWFSNLSRSVGGQSRSIGQGSTLPVPTVVSRGYRSTSYTRVGNAPRTAEPSNKDRLVDVAGGGLRYDDMQANTQETFDSNGRATALAWADGTRITFTYSDANTPPSVAPGANLLLQASDNLGRSLSFSYVVPQPGFVPQIQTITDATGNVTRVGYDGRNNLSTITWADGSVRTFVYEDSAQPWALTGIRDETATRYATFGYDGEGRAISTEHAGGVNRYSVSYTTPPTIQVSAQGDGNSVVYFQDWNLPQGVVMTLPNGSQSSWRATSLNGKNYFTGQTQAAGAGCGASSSGLAYDANGNVASQDDFNGTRSCYANDTARNLQVVQVDGLGQATSCAAVTADNASLPAGARKTSTQWHPDWSLPIKVAEPGQITTNVYNGQPDPFNGNAIANCASTAATLLDGQPIAVLCKQVTRATTDADGHLGFGAALQAGAAVRVSTWTYSEFGRVLTAKTTRGGVTVTSSSTYFADTDANHTKGDLQSITSSTGEVTTFAQYNRAGQVLQRIDPNGVVTVNTYDLRQRLLSTMVDGLTMTYEYDAVGQLKKATQPNGGWVGQDYDDAHRLKAVYDDQGNRIDYELDPSGQQTGQTTKDPNGSLKASLERVTDALNRAQRTAGGEE